MASTRTGYLGVAKETTRGIAVKPAKFVRFKEGDVGYKQEIIENNPIQNNRWNAINSVQGKVETNGSFKIDVDPNEIPRWIIVAMGKVTSSDVGTPTNATVFEHVVDHTNKVGSLTLEQAKGDLDTPMSTNGQGYTVERSFGVMVDSFKISGGDSILEAEVGVKAYGQFNVANMISTPSTATYFFDTVEGLVAGDSVKLYKGSTGTYENLTILSINQTANSVTFTTTPSGSYAVANSVKLELIPQTPSFQEVRTFSFVDTKFFFADTVANAYTASAENVENWEIEFMNNLEERYGSLRKSPSVIGEKGTSCKIKFEKYFETVADRDRYLKQTKRACVVKITNNEVVSATDTALNKYTIAFEFSDIRFTSHEMPTGTDELYVISAEATAFFDTTDGRAVRAKIKNKNAGTYYA